jgi:hypothetical protein
MERKKQRHSIYICFISISKRIITAIVTASAASVLQYSVLQLKKYLSLVHIYNYIYIYYNIYKYKTDF